MSQICLRIHFQYSCEAKYFRIQEDRYLSKSRLAAVSATHRAPAVTVGEGAEREVSYLEWTGEVLSLVYVFNDQYNKNIFYLPISIR